jgi:hypothetical protein
VSACGLTCCDLARPRRTRPVTESRSIRLATPVSPSPLRRGGSSDHRPGISSRRPPASNRRSTPSNCCRSRSGYGSCLPIGRHGPPHFHSSSAGCACVRQEDLPVRPPPGGRTADRSRRELRPGAPGTLDGFHRCGVVRSAPHAVQRLPMDTLAAQYELHPLPLLYLRRLGIHLFSSISVDVPDAVCRQPGAVLTGCPK